jgi:hypothetical protein
MTIIEDSLGKALRPGSARVSRDGFGVPLKQSLREVRDGETRVLPKQ